MTPLLQLRALTFLRQRQRRRQFRFQFRRRGGLIRARVAARRGPFRAECWLRPQRSDLRTFQQVFLEEFYHLTPLARWPELAAAFARRARRAPQLVVDLGANIGLSALALAQQWPQAHILAVEPSPDNFALLQRNAAAFAQIEPLAAAVAAADGMVTIANPEGPAAARRTAPAAAAAAGAIPALSMASLLARAAGAQPWLAKVDIEGAERELFADPSWMDLFPIVLVEPHDWMLPGAATAAPLLRALAARDRDFLLLGESVISLARGL